MSKQNQANKGSKKPVEAEAKKVEDNKVPQKGGKDAGKGGKQDKGKGKK